MWPSQENGKIKNVLHKMLLLWVEGVNPCSENDSSLASCWGSVLRLLRPRCDVPVSCEGHSSVIYLKFLLHLSPVQLDFHPSTAVIVTIHSLPMSVGTRLNPACWRSVACLRGTFHEVLHRQHVGCPDNSLNKAFIFVLRSATQDAKVRLILLI